MIWEIGPDVPDSYFYDASKGIAAAHLYVTSLGIPKLESQLSIYMYEDIAPVVVRLTDLSAEEVRRRFELDTDALWGSVNVGEDGTGWILLHLPENFSPDPKYPFMWVPAHELMHVYQYRLADYGGFSEANWQVREQIPWWIIEGGTEFLLNRAFAKGHLVVYDNKRNQDAERAAGWPVSLSEIESYEGWMAAGNPYWASALAAELLAAHAGEETVLTYWKLLGPEMPWQEAFEATFGMNVEDFYRVFEAHQAAGFPNLDLPQIGPSVDELPQMERPALVAFYNATGGTDWTDNTNWLSDEHIGNWHGVTVNSSGRVTKLELNQNGLRGELPPVLGSLTELRILSVSANRLSGPVPSELAALTRLEHFGVGGNRLSGEIPSWLSALSNLRVLHLVSNQFTGQIPSWIGNFPLQGLYLAHNRLSGDVPAELGNLSGLRYLYLAGNNLSGCIPSELQDVGHNDLADAGLPLCGR